MAVPPEQLAERGTRLLAASIDELILLGVSLPALIGAVMAALPGVTQLATGGGELDSLDTQALALSMMSGPGFTLSLLLLLAWAVITAWFVATNSQSIGKRIVGIKVVRSDGSPASFARIVVLRNVVNTLPALIPVMGLGLLYQLVDPLFIYQQSRQCLHDRIADTTVVRCNSAPPARSIAN